ncbi:MULTISPECIES: carboxymuconolactone decarboxylase family protein [Streptomyces]
MTIPLGPPVSGAGRAGGAAPGDDRAVRRPEPDRAAQPPQAAPGDRGALPDAVGARPFGAAYEEFVERFARGGPWARPGLDRRTRYLVTLTALAVGGHTGELAAYARAALRAGVSAEEIEETLLQAAPYCGLPAVGAAFDAVGRVMAEEAGA